MNSDVELFESICKEADKAKGSLSKLHDLWTVLRTNKNRLSSEHFDFAREHLGKYYEDLENKIEGENFAKKTASD